MHRVQTQDSMQKGKNSGPIPTVGVLTFYDRVSSASHPLWLGMAAANVSALNRIFSINLHSSTTEHAQ